MRRISPRSKSNNAPSTPDCGTRPPPAIERRQGAVWALALAIACALPRAVCAADSETPINANAPVLANADCFECHLDPATTRSVNGQEVPLAIIDTNRYELSVHRELRCVECHAGVQDIPHADALPPAQCASCHETATAEYRSSIHGVSHAMGTSAAATCADCHGTHDIVDVRTATSPVFKLNLPQTCAKCHSNPGINE